MNVILDVAGRPVSRRGFLGGAAVAGLGLAGAGGLLAGCAPGAAPGASASGGSGAGSGPVTWASWANPGEAEAYKKVSAAYTAKYGNKVTWQQVVGDYQTKILTQLAGGSAPDTFYVGDGQMATMIASGKLVPLDDYLASSDAAIKLADVYPGLYGWCKSKDGKLYGLPVDCNPKVFWFNKGLLQEAGVTTDPAAAFAAGTWNMAALDDLLTKVKATGKRGLVIESGWFDMFAYVTALGGKAWSEDGTKAVFDTDPKAMEILTWMFDHFKAGTISYGGSLPKGQGVDALFYSGQLATITYGRWILPNLRKLKNLQYDITTLPSADGKTISSAPVALAAMSVQTGAKDQQAALMFLGRYVNAEGQRMRLAGGGNAVPAVKGLEDIVLEGGVPANAKVFNEAAAAGYAIPVAIAGSATVATNFNTESDKLIKGGASAKDFATKMAAYVNAGG